MIWGGGEVVRWGGLPDIVSGEGEVYDVGGFVSSYVSVLLERDILENTYRGFLGIVYVGELCHDGGRICCGEEIGHRWGDTI